MGHYDEQREADYKRQRQEFEKRMNERQERITSKIKSDLDRMPLEVVLFMVASGVYK